MSHLTPEEEQYLERFYAGEDPMESVRYRLLVSGEDATEYVETIGCGPSEDEGPAHVLEATLTGFPVVITEQDDVSVDLYFGARKVRDFEGKVSSATAEGHVIELVAGTGGRWLPEEKLRAKTEYAGYFPSSVAHDVVSRLNNYYSGFDIPLVRTPLFNRRMETSGGETVSDNRFDYLDTLADVLATVEEESGLVILDSEHNFATGYRENPLDEAGDPVRELTVGVDIERPFHPEPTIERRYTSVEVYERTENGSYEVLGEAPITYYDPQIKPPRGAVLPLESTDKTTDKFAAAAERARKEANRYGKGEWSETFTVLDLDPRIRRTATVHITDVDPATGRKAEWTAIIRTHKRDPENQTTEVSAILTRERVTKPAPTLPQAERAPEYVRSPA